MRREVQETTKGKMSRETQCLGKRQGIPLEKNGHGEGTYRIGSIEGEGTGGWKKASNY